MARERLPLTIQALKEAGAVLVRTNGHRIFRLPNGKVVTVSCSASDWRADKNNLRLIRKLMQG